MNSIIGTKLILNINLMKKQTLLLLALSIISASTISAQERTVSEHNEPTTFIGLNPDFIQINPLTLKTGEDWWQPDTIIHHINAAGDKGRRTYSYNDGGYLVNTLNQKSGNAEWINEEKYVYEYDANDNLTSITRKYWQSSTNTWMDSKQTLYTYDHNDNLLTNIEAFRANDEWKYNYRTTYTYDDKNNQITELRESYETTIWKKTKYMLYSYDTENHLILMVQSRWDNDEWQDYLRISYEYNDNNYLISSIEEVSSNGNWRYSIKETTTYDDNNNKTSITTQVWHYINNVWYNSSRILAIYDGYDPIISLHQRFQDDEWNDDVKGVFEFDNHNCISAEAFVMIEDNWVNSSAVFRVRYNNNRSFLETSGCNKASISYIKTAKPKGVEDIDPTLSEINIYPNPANDNINISTDNKIDNVQIYSLAGKLVMQETSKRLNVSKLAAGMYVVKVHTDKDCFVGKVVIER